MTHDDPHKPRGLTGWLRSLFGSKSSAPPDEPSSSPASGPLLHNVADQQLATADHDFVCALAEALELSAEQCLELLMRPLEDSPMDHGPTELRNGSFVSLNLFRKIGPLQRIPGLDGLHALASLNCAIHALAELDLRGNPTLDSLDCRSHLNRDFRIDISACRRLVDVRYTPAIEYEKKYWTTLVCTELQKRVLFPKARKGIEVVPSTPDEMHAVVTRYNWDWGVAPLAWIAKHDLCDRGTALMIYWQGSPHWYAQYTRAADVPAHEKKTFALLRSIEKRTIADGYERNEFRFDPRADDTRGEPTDWTADHHDDLEVRRPIPEVMFDPCG
jgi:hypothetical protein